MREHLRQNCIVILLWMGLVVIDALDWLLDQLRPHNPHQHAKEPMREIRGVGVGVGKHGGLDK